MMKESGAEAIIIFEKNSVIKHRPKKSYRIEAIDKNIRRFRTRRETKVLETLFAKRFPVPEVFSSSDKTMRIRMEKIKGKKVRQILNNKNCKKLGLEIGRKIGILHSEGVIHGDLTTSNMILEDEVYFIDFGLSFFSTKTEDRAVDLHLIKETSAGTHPSQSKKFFEAVLKGYKQTFSDDNSVIERMKIVEERGRNKKKMGS
ncbi:MAG TPA: KEOPS complex kinase/ATPase Bud32 [Candidatus Nanoarchaeia archaeon]|nr:KEOPS complex kinase/ATPase Bud32 [Candidatus Nanoarchaeia archaeon]